MVRSLLALALTAGARPVPTPAHQEWADAEIGVIIHFNMATMIGSQGCNSDPPDVSKFNPTKLNTDQWVESMEALGAKYAVYVAKHGCGFAAWPTNVSFDFLPSYGYSVKEAPVKTDVAGSFVDSCRKKGIKPGFYYSLGSNHYLSDRLKLSQDQFNQVVMAQVEELWTNYGELLEIWFDGGYAPEIKANLTELLEKTQPNSVVFGGYGVAKSPVRWIGTEAGAAPYPDWSTTKGKQGGGGDAHGSDWVPGESDTTLQENDLWFYSPNHKIRSLKELQDVYHGTVGRNSNLLLDIAPTPEGVVDDAAVARYREFGDWIRGCYGPGQESNSTGAVAGSVIELELGNKMVDRVVIREDQKAGELIRSYQVQALVDGAWRNVSSGYSVGNKRIDIFTAVTAQSLRLTLQVDEGDPEPSLRDFAAYAPTNCGGSAPKPVDCGLPAVGQAAGFFDCQVGAHQVWDAKPNAKGQTALHLAGLSNGQDLCLTLTELPGKDGAANGRYTNGTELRACDGSAEQTWTRTESGQLTVQVGSEIGCLDCANCQGDASQALVYTPCYPSTGSPSNEAFDYDDSVKNFADKEFHKCLGICTQTMLV